MLQFILEQELEITLEFSWCSNFSIPQDLKFGGEKTTVTIGNNSTIREVRYN